MSRHDIFYWKCDCALSAESKQQSYFADKYDEATVDAARQAAIDFAGTSVADFKHLGVDGNHFAYRFSYDGKIYFLRTDDGRGDDDYLLAESAVLRWLGDRGLPVPRAYKTDVSMAKHPFRYQVLDFVCHPPLIDHYRKDELQRGKIAEQSGRFLAQLHEFQAPRFGFIDTDKLSASHRIQGLDASWEIYFHKCLDKHLAYLRDRDILTAKTVAQIEACFERNQHLLRISRGSLLHRDFALWNILGTPDSIIAVIDWDDTVVGDPADDIAIVSCFNDTSYMAQLLAAYGETQPVDESFRHRVSLYTLRNMLWKIMIRHYMGYFEKADSFFLNKNDRGVSLWEYSFHKLHTALKELT